MDDRERRVAVLGLGRMGSAVADRLRGNHEVRTWTRSGGGTAETAADAVADAEVVVLCLYDGPACREVLSESLASVPTSAVIVNTVTVAPQEARDLEATVLKHGARYLHAPVIGSSPAVASGRLTILAGGTPDETAAQVLGSVGETIDVRTSDHAAAYKLVANGVLGDAIITLRRALGRTGALDLDRETSLDILSRTLIGPLVDGKRELLGVASAGRRPRSATFTVGALAKDLELLSRTTRVIPDAAVDLQTLVSAQVLEPTDDVAALATTHISSSGLADARLDVSPEVVADPHALRPLHEYALGHATADADHFRRAFRQTAHIEGIRDGIFVSWDLETYCSMFTGTPALDEPSRWRQIDQLDVRGTVATATMTLCHGDDVFTDAFVLIRDPSETWKIANKTYARRPTP